jgi:hypothetical protein
VLAPPAAAAGGGGGGGGGGGEEESLRARAGRARLVELMNGLAARRRAGVVELGPSEGGTRNRRLFLVPPSASTAKGLALAWSPAECLFAVEVDLP